MEEYDPRWEGSGFMGVGVGDADKADEGAWRYKRERGTAEGNKEGLEVADWKGQRGIEELVVERTGFKGRERRTWLEQRIEWSIRSVRVSLSIRYAQRVGIWGLARRTSLFPMPDDVLATLP